MKTGKLLPLFILLALTASRLVGLAQTAVLIEGFETAFPEYNGWSVGDANPAGSYAYWNDVDINFGGEGAHTGNWKGYCAGFGFGGSSASPIYQNEMAAFMEKTIDLRGYSAATLRFWHKLPSVESCCDLAGVWVGGTRVWSDSNPTTAWTETAVDLTAQVGAVRPLRFEFTSDGTATAEGWYLDDILVTGFAVPVNDLCSGAIALTSGVPWTMETSGAGSTGEPAPECQGNFGKGVWFRHVAPASGALAISTCGSGFDTVLQVFEGNCERLQPVPNGCNDDHGPGCGGSQASVTISARAGTPYYILAGGYGGQGGTLTIVTRDAEPPNLVCPGILVTNTLRTTCDRPIAYGVSATDNQDPNPLVVCFPPDGTVFAVGTNSVHCMATDAAGNSRSCDFLVIVEDRVAPQITCPTNVVVQTDIYQCHAANVHYSAVFTDNCGLVSSGFVPLPPVTLPKGVWPITAYAVDAAGNSNVCVFTVTVLDREAPIPQPPGNRIVECGTPWEIVTPPATDNCDGTDLIVTTVVNTVSAGCGRVHTVQWTFTDSSGNQAQLGQTITETDTTVPVIMCASNRVVECGFPWTFDTPVATDTCDSNVTVRVLSTVTNAGCCGTFTAIRTWEARDACGNAATCLQTVSVVDTTAPWLTLPPLVGAQTDPGQCSSRNVQFGNVSALDNCDDSVVVACFPTNGATFPAGITMVLCSASDGSGNTRQGAFNVLVLDPEPPQIACPPDLIAYTDPGACHKTNVTYTVTAADNCPGGVAWCEPPSGSTFPRGTNVVRCTARDPSGNTNRCAFTVIILGFDPICTSLSSLPLGAIRSGQAYLNTNDGSLHLTDAVNSQQGTLLLPASRPLGSFRAAFKALVGDPTSAEPADGFSFCLGSDLSSSFGEEGSGTGLIVSFDTFRNAGEEAPAIDLKWGGATFARAPKRIITGSPATFVDVFIELTPAGEVTVNYGGDVVHHAVPVPGYSPIPGNAWFGFGARTGSLNAKHWIDDLCVNDDGACAPPRLTITRSNSLVTVTWPRLAEDWLLEWTNVLPKVVAPWPRIPPPYQTNGSKLQFTEPAPAGNKFFRLHKP
jgi:hypothetical protein